MNDVTIGALQVSLRGLASRQRAIADNIANIETPNYTAKRVEFESNLRAAMQLGVPQQAEISKMASSDPAGINGNNVNIENETLDLTDTNLRYQLAIEAVNNKFRLLRSAIKGTE